MDAILKAKDEPDIGNDDLISRQETAMMLGISVRSVQRMEETGELHRIYDAENNRVWHRRDEVERVAAKRQKTETEPAAADSAGLTPGQVAALVFSALRSGKSYDDIVIEHELHPDVVDPLYAAWLRRPEHLAVQGGNLAELRRMIGPLGTDEELVGKTRTLLQVYQALYRALGDGPVAEIIDRLNNVVAVYSELEQLFGPVSSVEALRRVAQPYIDAAEELKRFSRPCPRCGQWYQATAYRDWARLVEGGSLEDQLCGECTAREVTADMIERGRAAKAKKSDD